MSVAGRNRLLGAVLALVIFAFDRLVKALVAGPLGLVEQGQSRFVLPVFNFTREHNFGVSLSMFPATSQTERWLLVAITSAIALAVIVWLLRERRLPEILPLGLILGGAVGNIIDRVRLGYVLDYADLHFGEWRPFLIFNLADAAISIGVFIILVRALFMREKPAPAHGDAPADQPAESS